MAECGKQDPAEREPARVPLRLALFGLPPELADPLTSLAEILGWQVLPFPPGPAVRPAARLCIARLPAGVGVAAPPLAVWSPVAILNEHISRSKLSIMDQPLCLSTMEQMLEALACEP